jgi:hypothetical protein
MEKRAQHNASTSAADTELDLLDRAARKLVEERLLSRGGPRPSEAIIQALTRFLALRACRDVKDQTSAAARGGTRR